MRVIDRQFWRGRRVFVTGHMGFKGAWLCSLLAQLGAETLGFGKDERERLLYRELKLTGHSGRVGDINDIEAMKANLAESRAEILFHLAAQPIVLTSYPIRSGHSRRMSLALACFKRRGPRQPPRYRRGNERQGLSKRWVVPRDEQYAGRRVCAIKPRPGSQVIPFRSFCEARCCSHSHGPGGNVISGGD
jgi:hypothetical protein